MSKRCKSSKCCHFVVQMTTICANAANCENYAFRMSLKCCYMFASTALPFFTSYSNKETNTAALSQTVHNFSCRLSVNHANTHSSQREQQFQTDKLLRNHGHDKVSLLRDATVHSSCLHFAVKKGEENQPCDPVTTARDNNSLFRVFWDNTLPFSSAWHPVCHPGTVSICQGHQPATR